MPRIPLPRRGLRSLLVLSCLILGPYFLWRRLGDAPQDGDYQGSGIGIGGLVYGGASGGSWADRLRGNTRDVIDIHANLDHDEPDLDADLRAGQGNGLVLQKEEVDPWAAVGAGTGKGKGKGKGKATNPKAKPPPGDRKLPRHEYLPNGLVKINSRGRHPIYDLIEMSKAKWQKKLDGASKTLKQAVDEYRRRYGRAPPKGFDRWWNYAQKHNVQLPDEYDQIFHDLEPFHALRQPQLLALLAESAEMSGMYTITCPGKGAACSYKINDKGLNDQELRIAQERVEAQLSLLKGIEGDLEEITAVFYSQDVPWQFVGHEYKSALEDAASLGEYFDSSEHEHDNHHLGWPSACAPHKPLRHEYDMNVLPDLEGLWNGEKSFIWDHKASMDACLHPTYTHLMGFLSGHGKGPGPSSVLYPIMAMCKTTLHSDVLAVAMEAWTEDVGDDPPWEKKRDDRLLWRGKNTGIFFKDSRPWNISQRINLVEHTAMDTGTLPVYSAPDVKSPIGQPKDTPLARLNTDLVDVAFVDRAIQCDPEVCKQVEEGYHFAERKDWTAGNQYKYILDVDGNGWSARFKRLMSTNSAILKSTIFPEWYTDRVQPWVHYIPVKPDLTDLYDIMSFFRANDATEELAKEIASEGKVWSKSFWRHEDMVSYQFRLFLELSRLMAPNRDAASYHDRGA